MANRTQISRISELDSLRGIAAFAVMIFHFTTHFDKLYGHTNHISIDLSLGRYGVELFFMISGYVIFLTLDKTRKPLDFMVSRVSRLYPAYWAAMPITFLIATQLDLPGYTLTPNDYVINLTMAQELASTPHVDNVYWTLHRELGFYVLMGALFYSVANRYIMAAIAFLIAFAIVTIKLELVHRIPGLWLAFLIFPIAQLHLFGLGAALYAAQQGRISNATFLAIVFVSFTNAALAVDIAHATTISVILLTVALATRSKLKLVRHGFFIFLGAISYPLYLIHNNAGSAIILTLEQRGLSVPISILFAVTFAVVTAFAIHRIVEKPALQAIRFWYKEKFSRQ